MKVIYKITNTENGKVYIGQTVNWSKRKNDYSSTSFNPNSNEYTRPINSAIRKYGLSKFRFDIVEEIADEESAEYLNERECFFIEHFKSLVTENGYNIQIGGQSGKRTLLTYTEKLVRSKVFSSEEIADIQKMLIAGEVFSTIYKKYPKMTQTFLSNINTGLNFNNPEWSYPLNKHSRSQFSSEEIENIKKDIISGIAYQEICNKWGIASQGFVSEINTGKKYSVDGETYPLRKSLYNGKTAPEAQRLLITMDWSSCKTKAEIYQRVADMVGYNQTGSVKKIDLGLTTKNSSLRYPILSNQEYNKLHYSK